MPASAPGARLDLVLSRLLPNLSRSRAQRLIVTGCVSVAGVTALKPADVPTPGQTVTVRLPAPQPTALQPLDLALDVVYADADVLVIAKPAGLVVHPAAGHAQDTLVNALLARYPDLQIGDSFRPGIVHRLDKDTSGLLVVARHDAALAALAAQMAAHTVDKRYLALVHGRLLPTRGTIDAPIGRDPHDRKRMAVIAGGRPARTHYRVLHAAPGFSLVAARLETGRTHQIRVHLASLGHPIAGDALYCRQPAPAGLTRQFLHAWQLAFASPADGSRLTFGCPLPPDLSACLGQVGITPEALALALGEADTDHDR